MNASGWSRSCLLGKRMRFRIPCYYRTTQVNLLNLHSALAAGSDRRRDLTQIQWFVVIACSYLLVVQDNQLAQDPLSLLLLAGPLLSMLIFLRLPDAAIMHGSFPHIMAAIDRSEERRVGKECRSR